VTGSRASTWLSPLAAGRLRPVWRSKKRPSMSRPFCNRLVEIHVQRRSTSEKNSTTVYQRFVVVDGAVACPNNTALLDAIILFASAATRNPSSRRRRYPRAATSAESNMLVFCHVSGSPRTAGTAKPALSTDNRDCWLVVVLSGLRLVLVGRARRIQRRGDRDRGGGCLAETWGNDEGIGLWSAGSLDSRRKSFIQRS
jgi:hypothetical protein